MDRLAGSIVLVSGARRSLSAFLAGAVLALAQAPFDFIIVGFISLPVLVWLLDGAVPSISARGPARLMPAFAVGWWFGFGYFIAGLWWVANAFMFEGATFWWVIPWAVLGLPAYLAIFFGIAAALAQILWSDGIGRIAALAAAFAVSEWLRETLLSGFPWNPIGFALMPVPMLMQSVNEIGVVGMNALAVFVFAMPALVSGRKHRILGLLSVLALLAAHAGYGYYRLSVPPVAGSAGINVRIVQPNIDLHEKWDPSVAERNFKSELRLSALKPDAGKPAPDVIIWPETSVPYLFEDRPQTLTEMGAVLSGEQRLIAGAARSEGEGADVRYFNSIVTIDREGKILEKMDKVHLVPFGEYFPFEELFSKVGISQIVAGPTNFVAGTRRRTLTMPGGLNALPFICYEIIFPGHMPAETPARTFILNVTNDAWFGNTPGPYQHLRQTQIRAVETGMPVVRAANTGISAIVDPSGRIVDALALNTQGIIDARVPVPAVANSAVAGQRWRGLAVILIFALAASLFTLHRRMKSLTDL